MAQILKAKAPILVNGVESTREIKTVEAYKIPGVDVKKMMRERADAEVAKRLAARTTEDEG